MATERNHARPGGEAANHEKVVPMSAILALGARDYEGFVASRARLKPVARKEPEKLPKGESGGIPYE